MESKATSSLENGAQNSSQAADTMMLMQVFDRIVLPILVLDKNHRIIHWNSALEALSSYDRSEMLGTKNHWKPFYSSARPMLADLILEGGKDQDVKRHYTDKCMYSELIKGALEGEDFFPDCGQDGEWLHFTASAIYNDEGEIIGAIETFENISARKQAEFELLERSTRYKELSITDALTGLHNSRQFHSQLETACRDSHPFAVCFFDLDDFKSLNDTHGHLVGDKVLEKFGELVRSSLRALDSGYRYGGEEFVLILPSTTLEDAVIVAERIRKSLEDYSFTLDCGNGLQVCTSIGVTSFKHGDNSHSLMKRVDTALYQAKDQGKNRLVSI